MSKMRFLRLATHGRLIGLGVLGWKGLMNYNNGMRDEEDMEDEGIKATFSGQCMKGRRRH